MMGSPWIGVAVWQACIYAFFAYVAWDLYWIIDLGGFEPNARVAIAVVWLFLSIPCAQFFC